MKHLKNERGYALFLAVLIIVLFGVLAVSLMTIVMSGTKKTDVREDITQATELSEKGLQHITNQINKELEDALGENGLPRSEFAAKLIAILNQYKCKNDGNLQSFDKATGDYNVCIDDFENVKDENGNINDLRKLVEFRSIGEVNGKTKEIVSYIEIGAGTVPDALKYVLGTIEPVGKRNAGDGNIYLHGGLEIYGDIKADNNLFTFNHGPALATSWRVSYANWRQTTLPVLYPSPGSNKAKIVLGGDLYTFKSTSNFTRIVDGNNITQRSLENFYDTHLAWEYLSRYKKSSLDKLFANTNNLPALVKRDWKGNRVSIEGNITEGKNKINPTINVAEKEFRNINTNAGISFKNYYQSGRFTYSNNNMIFKQTNRFKNGEILKGNRTTFLKGDYQFDSMYINTNVVIGNSSTTDDPKYYDEISIGGYSKDRGAQLFVDGNVTIQGANLKSNLTIYTTGTVTIQYTTIQGRQFAHNKEGSLIVFSKGRVHISNNSLYKDKASELKGYFYSEDTLEMFGVGSKIKIHGGIAARRITLNAIRGNYNRERKEWRYAINPTRLQSPSRLVIEYDTELIENFLKLNPPEPVIYDVDPPQLIDRK